MLSALIHVYSSFCINYYLPKDLQLTFLALLMEINAVFPA